MEICNLSFGLYVVLFFIMLYFVMYCFIQMCFLNKRLVTINVMLYIYIYIYFFFLQKKNHITPFYIGLCKMLKSIY